MLGRQPQQQRWCCECGEDRAPPQQPASDRLCDICGTPLETRDAPTAAAAAAAPATVTIPLRQLRRLRELLLASLTGGEGELGLAADMAMGLSGGGGPRQQEGGQQGQEGAEDEIVDVQTLLAQLGLLGGGGGGGPGGEEGGGAGTRKGLTDEEIAALPRSTLQTTSTLLLACTLTCRAPPSSPLLEMAAIPGDFSPVPPQGDGGGAVDLELVAGEPLTADAPAGAFANAEALRGRMVVVQRGKQTFGKMVQMATAAGARGVCVVNSVSLWPYLMKDTAGEARKEAAGRGEWFVVMVPQREGQALLERLRQAEAVTASLAVTRVEKDCVICVEAFAEGEEVVRLPQCGHGFHALCLQRWLTLARTCPYCRAEVKVRKG